MHGLVAFPKERVFAGFLKDKKSKIKTNIIFNKRIHYCSLTIDLRLLTQLLFACPCALQREKKLFFCFLTFY